MCFLESDAYWIVSDVFLIAGIQSLAEDPDCWESGIVSHAPSVHISFFPVPSGMLWLALGLFLVRFRLIVLPLTAFPSPQSMVE